MDIIFLLVGGFLAGIVNTLAGGGSFIAFPILILVGINPVVANATNTFAMLAGYVSGAWALKDQVQPYKKDLIRIVIFSTLGGVFGAWLLLVTDEQFFKQAIPYLLFFATFLLIFSQKIRNFFTKLADSLTQNKNKNKKLKIFKYIASNFFIFTISLYGGFFNAGLGILILSYLALLGQTNINAMNGIKLIISAIVALVATILFAYTQVIAWTYGLIMMLATLIGGFVAAKLAVKIPQKYIRFFVICTSLAISSYFLWQNYSH